jgi:hypothetical protein
VAPSAKRRTGLIPMQPGSQHNLPMGEGKIAVVVARDRESVPHGTKATHICLHTRCAGKRWATFAEMQGAHPQASQMARADEVHVYGLWSDDPQDERARLIAEAAAKEASKEHDESVAALKAAKTTGDRDYWREEKATRFTAKLEADKALAAVSGCVGLIAPADPSRAAED